MRFNDILGQQGLQAKLQQPTRDALITLLRVDRKMLYVTAPAIVPGHQAGDDSGIGFGDKTEPRIALQVALHQEVLPRFS